MTKFRTILAALAASAALLANASLGFAESEGGDSYLKCKPGYQLNFSKTKCVKK